MKLKYYAEVTDLKKAIEFYSEVFDGEIVKGIDNGNHGYVKGYGVIQILIWGGGKDNNRRPGYHIIRFEDSEKDIYLESVERVRKNSDATITIDNSEGRWGTTFFEFKDPFGYTWDFEINTSALK